MHAEAVSVSGSSPKVAIVGAGQSGLQLALGLLQQGYDVTVVSNRTPEEIAVGPVLSSQCMFETALQTERVLGLDHWTADAPAVARLAVTVEGSPGASWSAPLDWPAQSVDQRLKIPRWLGDFTDAGGRLLLEDADEDGLERYGESHDLVVVATGRGPLARLFPPDLEKSPYTTPQRKVALTYLQGVEPSVDGPTMSLHVLPGVGECLLFPAVTTSGPCEIVLFEAIPGSPMDCWSDVETAGEHFGRTLDVLRRFCPAEASRFDRAELTDANGMLRGSVTPTVRKPIARLRSGRAVLGMADAVVLNDPLTSQGANNAAKCAEIYLSSIVEATEFGADFMQRTFDRYWRGYAQWVVAWTNSFLAPPPHVERLHEAAAELPELARTIANGFDDPRVFYPWWFDSGEADRLIAEKRKQGVGQVDVRALRRALGQYATGVTVVTALADDGRPVGVTANSFTSVSLEPPLVLWCLSHDAGCFSAFQAADRFAVNVLSAQQHYLSRQFSTPANDKFTGVELVADESGLPVLEGALAHFVCRVVQQFDAGDHEVILGEVERFGDEEGEPLVFHSGGYRVATRHPKLDA